MVLTENVYNRTYRLPMEQGIRIIYSVKTPTFPSTQKNAGKLLPAFLYKAIVAYN